MKKFIAFISKDLKLSGTSLRTQPAAISSILKQIGSDPDNLKEIYDKRSEIKELLLGPVFAASTSNSYASACKNVIKMLKLKEDEQSAALEFYSGISRIAQSAHKTMLHPDRQLKPRGMRANEALERYGVDLKSVIDAQRNPEPMEYQNNMVSGIPAAVLPDDLRDIYQKVEYYVRNIMRTKKGGPLQGTSIKQYLSNIRAVMRKFKVMFPELCNDPMDLDFTVLYPEKVIELFDAQKSVYVRKPYETAVTKFLPLAKGTDEERRDVWIKYNTWLTTTQERNPAPRFKVFYGQDYLTGDENVEYNWPMLLQNVAFILEHMTVDPIQKMFMLLFTTVAPRRSRDYSNMLVDVPDDKKHNILDFKKKEFIFNSYKNSAKLGPQTISITSKPLLKDLKAYRDQNPGKFLFERNGKPMTKDQIQHFLRVEIGDYYGIPFGINALRHLFASHVFAIKTHPRDMQKIAESMGTSIKMLHTNYIDVKDKELDDDPEDVTLVKKKKPAKATKPEEAKQPEVEDKKPAAKTKKAKK